MNSPSTHVHNGHDANHDANGRFAPGNKLGRGNPHAGRAAQIRALLLAELNDDDVSAMIQALIVQARGGDIAAIKELLDRAIGKAKQSIELDGPQMPSSIRVIVPGLNRDGGYAGEKELDSLSNNQS